MKDSRRDEGGAAWGARADRPPPSHVGVSPRDPPKKKDKRQQSKQASPDKRPTELFETQTLSTFHAEYYNQKVRAKRLKGTGYLKFHKNIGSRIKSCQAGNGDVVTS